MVGASSHMGEPYFFFLETTGSTEPLIWGKMCPQNWFFGFHSAGMGFLKKKFQSRIWYPFFREEVIFFFVIRQPIPRKIVMPPPLPYSKKKNFGVILENIDRFFFEKNC